MVEQALEKIKRRRSVRTFSGEALREETLSALRDSLASVSNPYGVPIEFRVLDAAEHGLTSAVLVGAKTYVAGKLRLQPCAEEAFGFALERFVLDADAMGVGTVWIGGTMNREAFEKAMEMGEDEFMPCVTPLGYPAEKMSVRETVMRKGVGADKRLPFPQIAFSGSFDRPLEPEAAGALAPLVEMVRWAPSAVNKQPWRLVVCDGAVHFYERKDKGYVTPRGWDMQKIDLGIALCHFQVGLDAAGMAAKFELRDPGLPVPENTEYIASFIL
jgi:nitroreductase